MRVISLNGAWRVQRVGTGQALAARVPGDVFADLLRAKAIPDPFYRDHERDVQWVGETAWVYKRSFTVAQSLLRNRHIVLACEGLDTFAMIRINGRHVATTNNMFRTWEWDVRRYLKPGLNRIEVRFESAVVAANRLAKTYRPGVWSGHGESNDLPYGLIRKQACNGGWDWGVKMVTCGIWRSITLRVFNDARIGDVDIRQVHKKQRVDLLTTVTCENSTHLAYAVQVTVRQGKRQILQKRAPIRDAATIKTIVRDPKLWWPNGLGKQPLYHVDVDLIDVDGTVLDRWTRRIGLRTLRLDRHKDEWGESFQFVVNGVPFFAKGANWIPNDAVQGRMTPARYQERVRDAAAVNMNMLRVWGGGVYEDEAFYEACDEAGICVWQDFMFACAAYPTFDESFLENCAAEARDQVRRLRHHPCLALWCGNNELEMGSVHEEGWPRQRMPWDEYSRLFDDILGDVVAELSPETSYWPGSPHTPHGDRSNHEDPTCGDAHLWAVWHGGKPFEWYRTCEHRFNSEFGFQSFPEPKTVRAYTRAGDRNVTSRIMAHHQRSWIGNRAIIQYMCDWFLLPKDFESTLWLSQILQGLAMKYACEHWRRSMPRGMGTLYWQYNDTWPVASWSSVDYDGRWKALHYMARHFFAPVLISGVEDGAARSVAIHLTSDRLASAGGVITWLVTDAAGKRIRKGQKRIKTPVNGSACVHTVNLSDELRKVGDRNLLVWLEAKVKGEPVSRNVVTFARPKYLDLAVTPGIHAKPVRQKDGHFLVTLTTRRPAMWVWVELDKVDAVFSDNFVHLCPGRQVTIRVDPKRSMMTPEFRKRLMVRSLVDTFEA